ncbi:hypothetical protein TYRP_022834, partial [Tyrophagus putrescentiae]
WLLTDGTSIIGSLVFATVMHQDGLLLQRCALFADLLKRLRHRRGPLSLPFRLYFTPGAMFFRCSSISGRNCRRSYPGRSDAHGQAKSNNLADVSAKDNSQERMVNLAALAFSLLIIPLVSERPFLIWCLFLLATATHVYANYRAVRAVRLDVFNANRLAIFFEEMLVLVGEDSLKWMSASQNTSKKYHQLSVALVNSRENVWLLNTDRRDRLFSNLQLSYGRFESNSDLEMEQQQQSDSSQPSSLFHFSDRSQRWYRLTMSQFEKKKDNKVSFNLEGRLYVDRSSSESNYLPPEELTSLQLSLLYAVFLLNYVAEECQLKMSPKLQKIAQLVREEKVECRFEALRLAATTAEATQEELIKAAKSSGWRTSHMLISELFADDNEEEEGDDGSKSVSFSLEGRLYVDRSSSESNYLPPEELTSLQLSLLYAVFLLNYVAEECQLKRMKRSSPRLQKIAQLVREEKMECRFETLRLAAATAEATQEELIKA